MLREVRRGLEGLLREGSMALNTWNILDSDRWFKHQEPEILR